MAMRKIVFPALALAVFLNGPARAQPPISVPAHQIDAVLEQQQPFLLDVRTADEVRQLGTLPGSVNIPVDELEQRLDELPRDRLILTA